MRWTGIAAGIIALLAARDAASCTCVDYPGPWEALVHSDAVFLGRVVSVRDVPGDPNLAGTRLDHARRLVLLDIEEAWKGLGRESAKLTDNTTTCSVRFEEGRSYLVYARRDGEGRLRTIICDGSKPRERATADLSVLGAPMTPADRARPTADWIAQLASGSLEQRVRACNILALRPADAERSAPALANLLLPGNTDDDRVSAAAALRTLGPAAESAVPALIAMAGERDAGASNLAIRTLTGLGRAAAPAVPRLISLLDSTSRERELSEQLERAAATHDKAARDIHDDLQDLRAQPALVIECLGAIGSDAGDGAVHAVIAAIRSERVAPRAAAALVDMGAGASAAAAFLEDLRTRHGSPIVAAWALRWLGPEAMEAVPDALGLLKDPDLHLREAAVELLYAVGPDIPEPMRRRIAREMPGAQAALRAVGLPYPADRGRELARIVAERLQIEPPAQP